MSTTPLLSPPPASPLAEFTRFAAELAALLDTSPAGWEPDTRLSEDLHWDSLTLIEVAAHLDDRGAHLPEELLSELRTLGDVHHYLESLATGPRTTRTHDLYRGPNVQLVPVTARDYDWLFALHAGGSHLTAYRLRGQTPSPEQFQRFLWERQLTQFVVATHDRRPVGFVSAFEPDFRNRYAYIAAVADPQWEQSGLVLEGAALLISFLFAQFDLRKVYAESLASNFERFASGNERIFTVEGRLRDHEYIDGAYEDFVVAAIWREAWRHHHHRLFGTHAPF
jgi:RimJ/RimL family protein N-acetyltransferase